MAAFPASRSPLDPFLLDASAGLASLRRTFSSLMKVLHDPYRPELHYMRGPGPKWHEKHARAAQRA
jgi:hypothetical protein